jgi:uncharacterized protein YcbK (DUF882 family)
MTTFRTTFSRRRWLRLTATGLAAVASPAWANPASTREVAFDHLHTGEKLSLSYYRAGRYDEDALLSINHLLRDFRTGDVHPIDTRLIDLLHGVRTAIGSDAPFQVISGYRTPATNGMLRKASSGVATNSLHMQGMAIDVRLVDTRTSQLREVAARLNAGGVGYYKSSDFVHLDIGRPRQW